LPDADTGGARDLVERDLVEPAILQALGEGFEDARARRLSGVGAGALVIGAGSGGFHVSQTNMKIRTVNSC
jgi:hypothetical protein